MHEGREYFTVSANGVTCVRRGLQAEFVPLSEWVRQHSLFDLVSAIRFFKHYMVARAFRRWHNVGVWVGVEGQRARPLRRTSHRPSSP